MIPVLGVPIVNGFHWLERLVDSIDFPIDKLVILNNNSDDFELTNNLNILAETKHHYINTIKLCNLPSNIGVSASWNLIIKSDINAPYWLITNHDISFTPGLLKAFFDAAQNPDFGIIHGSGGDFGDGSYDVFLIKDWMIQKLGLFDENFYPAYCEDADYVMRITRHNWNNPDDQLKTICLNIPYYHGSLLSNDPDCYQQSGSQTKRLNSDLWEKFDKSNLINFEYMNKKWGQDWRNTNPLMFPMNIENMPLTYTSYDLDFCRSKHISFTKQIKKKNNIEIFYHDSVPEEENGIIQTNNFKLNSRQDSRFFVIDNFYYDPDSVREFALKQKYFPGEGAVGHRTRKQFLFDGLKERFESIIQAKIPDHTDNGYGWKDIGINGRFQYVPAGTNLVYHCDEQKWAAMVFLNPDAPPSAGTSFFRHRNTKIYHNNQINREEGQQYLVFNQKTFLDRTPYELTDQVSNVYNRLIIFDGGLIHSASEYFGWDIYTSRLFHIFFFNSI